MKASFIRFLLPLFLLVFASVGCDSTKRAKKLGESCEDDKECESGLCYFNKCLDPDSDDDMDGLTNANEKLIGTNPHNPDSDSDGKDDFSEVGKVGTPNDSDGDGILDANESSVSDLDKDCLPDEFDPENSVPTENLELLKEFGCMKQGVCQEGFADINAFCEKGVLKCEYDKVADFEKTETKCDNRDNDCNGETDEGLMSTTEGECKSDGICGAVGAVINRKCEAGKWVCLYSELPDYEEKETKCDNKDNDCDGKADEDIFSNTEGECKEVGVCGAEGVVIKRKCEAGKWVCLYGDSMIDGYEETETTCDNKDNDCDGKTDNGLANSDISNCKNVGVCGAKDAKIEMKCENGEWVCDYSKVADYSEYDAKCDGIDNDCDNETDEDYPPVACELVNIYGKCTGLTICAAGDQVCDAQVPAKEKCDKLDNNCNDMTDEGDICAKTAEVSGDVYNSSSQQPVQGASVSAYSAGNCPKQFMYADGMFPFLYDYMELYSEVQPEDWDMTDDQGSYSLYLKPGEYCVLVQAEGYKDLYTWIFVTEEGDTLPLSIPLVQEGDENSYISVCGRVREYSEGAIKSPVVGATVNLAANVEGNVVASAKTNGTGLFCITGVLGLVDDQPFTPLMVAKKAGFFTQKQEAPYVPNTVVFVEMSLSKLPDYYTECFSDDFETELNVWSVSSPINGVSWHRRENSLLLNSAIGKCVNLPEKYEECVKNPSDPFDLCAVCYNPTDNACIPQSGAIANSFSGKYAYWFGSETTGSYLGEGGECAVMDGGSSVSVVSGILTSPPINLYGVDSAFLTFYAWWEIESVDPQAPPGGYDLMLVQVIPSDAEPVTVGYMNPDIDQNGAEFQPFTSSGFNLAPQWNYYSFDISEFTGQEIRIAFSFDSKDTSYNGFRGWLIDDVKVLGSGCAE